MSVGGGVKGTIKLCLSLEGPLPIRNVSTTIFCLGLGGGGVKNSLKLLRLSLEVPPPIR